MKKYIHKQTGFIAKIHEGAWAQIYKDKTEQDFLGNYAKEIVISPNVND